MAKRILISAFIPGSMHSLWEYYRANLQQSLRGVKVIFHDHYSTGRLRHYIMRLGELLRSYDMVVSDYSSKVFTRSDNSIYMSHGYGTKLEPGLDELNVKAKMDSLRMMRSNVKHLVTLGEYNKGFYWHFPGEPADLPYPHVYPLGLPRNDVLYDAAYLASCRADMDARYDTQGKFIILFAPTWRGYETDPPFTQADFEDLDRRMGEQNSCMFYRPHYLGDLYAHVDFSRFKHIYDGAFSQHSKASTLMAAADMVLTDYSTIYIDYLALDRPVAFSVFDWDRFSAFRGVPYKKDDELHLPGLKIERLTDLTDYIALLQSGRDDYADLRRRAYQMQVKYRDGNSSARVWALMLDVLGLDRPELLEGLPGKYNGGEQL